MRWRLIAPDDTAVLRFGDEALVFNPASWETHLLNASAALVLDALAAGPRSVGAIVGEVAARVDAGGEATVPADFDGQVTELLGQLASLGLVAARA